MEWVHDIKGQQYELLLNKLFTSCDTVQCIVREENDDYFEEIMYECIQKKYVTQWPLTCLGKDAVPVLQYTFHCHYVTAQFFKEKQKSLFSWSMPYPEDLSFWKDGTCVFASCSHEHYVDIDESLQKQLEHLMTRQY